MKMHAFLLFLFVWLLFLVPCSACDGQFVFTLGPEIYIMDRRREGGTHQRGRIHGIRVGLDRIRGNHWYAGADFFSSSGLLSGETATGRAIESQVSDQIFEARLGFTLQQQGEKAPFIIPFGGWGYFREINRFFHPSPLPCTFTDTFHYTTAGFLSGINLAPALNMGINFKMMFMQGGRSKVSDDPLYPDVTLLMKDEMQVRVDIPVYYFPKRGLSGLFLQCTPFFEYRHFGGREGFPFNFRDTKFYLYGARVGLGYVF